MITRRFALASGPALLFAAQAGAQTPDGPFSAAAIAAELAALDTQAHLRTGAAGELALAARMEARLQASGFKITRQTVSAPFFEARETKLSWAGGAVEVFPQHIVVPTGPGGVTAPLQLWRPGDDPAILAGKIAVVLLQRARHSQLTAGPSGPALRAALTGRPLAVVLITEGPTGETIILNAPYDRPIADVPIAVLGPKPGKEAIAAARAGATARLVIDGESGRRNSYNLIGRIERRGRPWLVVSTPRSGWTPAVAERGPGIAAWMALAGWAPGALANWSVLFVATVAHEYDNAGGQQFLASALAPRPDQTALWAHLGAGFAGRGHHDFGGYNLAPLPGVDDQRFLIGSEALAPLLRQAFAGQPGLEAVYPASVGATGELGEVLHAGYSPAFGMLGGHLRHHIMNDRLAMTDPTWIRQAALATQQVIAAWHDRSGASARR